MRTNVGVWKNTVERDRYNILNILFSEVAERAVNSEHDFNDIKLLLDMKLEMLKKSEIEPKSPSTSECNEREEKYSPEAFVDVVIDDCILDPKYIKRPGRPRSNTYKNTWKHSKKTTCNDVNTCNEDVPVAIDVSAPPTKKRGRPPCSKNKEKKTTNSRGDGSVQVVSQQESSGLLAQPAHMYPPNGLPRDRMYQANGVAQQVH
ncbi:hypothetical protein C5167_032797 [Papaver somniferum]|uniref:Uncharacterized protein n=1 Tax=Papaver somniferum TaxID=3469 RepID=A0A4Y7KBD9_PAPSO|nr:uncharacterized protein LOC113297735 [Papaver somniferum]RZC69662.1 hypothetical protein C5167_032797 [Papaver somniferum]